MPSFKQFLEYLTTPGLEDIWVILDVKIPLPTFAQALLGDKAVLTKLDNYTDDLFRSIAATLNEVQPSSRPWNQRAVVGCWAVSFNALLMAFEGKKNLTMLFILL